MRLPGVRGRIPAAFDVRPTQGRGLPRTQLFDRHANGRKGLAAGCEGQLASGGEGAAVTWRHRMLWRRDYLAEWVRRWRSRGNWWRSKR